MTHEREMNNGMMTGNSYPERALLFLPGWRRQTVLQNPQTGDHSESVRDDE